MWKCMDAACFLHACFQLCTKFLRILSQKKIILMLEFVGRGIQVASINRKVICVLNLSTSVLRHMGKISMHC